MNGFSYGQMYYDRQARFPMQQIRPSLIIFDLGQYITTAIFIFLLLCRLQLTLIYLSLSDDLFIFLNVFVFCIVPR